jgi:hypothetical protein
MPYQNISAELTNEDREYILTRLNEITARLPFLVNLTLDERRGLSKMGDKSVAFVTKAMDYASTNLEFVPPYLNVPELTKDANLANQLLTINNVIQILAEKIDDTLMAVGAEAYSASRTFYNSVKNAAKEAVPGADAIASDLSARFTGQGRKKETTEV